MTALRAHDTRIVETLAEQQAPSRAPKGREASGESEEQDAAWAGVSGSARALLKFSTPRDPAALAAFINLRVLNPEHAHWRRGIEAATLYHRLHGDLRVPFTYRVPAEGKADAENEAPGGAAGEGAGAGEGELVWPPSLTGFPLGQWTADARRFHARGNMDADRIIQLEKLGMIWSHYDVAWEEGLTAARAWAAKAGHLLAPLDATHQGYKVGIWLKNARAATRRALELEQYQAEGLPVESWSGALSPERREQLEEIDPSWCPAWPVTWQRCFHLTRLHLDAAWNTAHHSGRRRAPRRRSGALGDGTAGRVGQTHRGAAMDAGTHPRDPTRQRGREAEATHQPGTEMGDAPRRGPAVLRPRGTPTGSPQTRRNDHYRRRGREGRRGPEAAGHTAETRCVGQQPAVPGRVADARTDRATLRGWDAVVLTMGWNALGWSSRRRSRWVTWWAMCGRSCG